MTLHPSHFLHAAAVALTVGLAGTPLHAQTPATNAPAWEKSAAIGVTLTRGNSKSLLFTGNVRAERKGEKNELSLGADATYGEANDVKNSDSIRGFVQYNRLFTERFYGYGRLEGLHDDIADLYYRLTFSPGAGYYFIKNDSTRLSAEAGPGFVYEKQGTADPKGYFTVRVAEKFEHKLNDRVRIWQSVELLPQVDDLNNYIINAEAGIESALTKKLSLRTFAQDTYDNEPAAGRQKNDFKLVTGLAYKF